MNKTILLFATIPLFAENLLPNGEFETNHLGWALWDDASNPGVATIDWENPNAIYEGDNGVQITVSESTGPANNWMIQLQAPHTWIPEPNTLYEISFYGKGPGNFHLGLNNLDYDYVGGMSFGLTNDWKKYTGTFNSGDESKIRINFYLGELVGTYAFDNITLQKKGVLEESWYQGAEDRINTIRKDFFTTTLLDADNNPTRNTPIEMKLLQHEFPFGTAMAFQGGSDEQWYRQTMSEYFWAGVIENDFKWVEFERSQGSPRTEKVAEYLDWSEEQGWQLMRGHALEWGIENWGWDSFWARTGTCEEYKSALKLRIDRDMQAFKGRFHHYDVWNEAFHERALFEKCGYDLLDSAFIWARAADPTAKLYINEYSVVSGGQTQDYIDLIQGMVDRKVPFDGIGVQCHYNPGVFNAAMFKLRVDQLAQFGKPILITEFDIGMWNFDEGGSNNQSEAEQAEEMTAFIRSAFSHDAIEGLLFWGFWDNRHWVGAGTNGGGIFREDKTAKPAADSIKHLWRTQWTTSMSGTTNELGQFVFHGFKGLYEIKANGINYKVWFGENATNQILKADGSTSATQPQSSSNFKWKSTAQGVHIFANTDTPVKLFQAHGQQIRQSQILKKGSHFWTLPSGNYILEVAGEGHALIVP